MERAEASKKKRMAAKKVEFEHRVKHFHQTAQKYVI